MTDKKETSLSSTQAPYIPPHLRIGSHFRTSEKASDLERFPRSMYNSRRNNMNRRQGPWYRDHPLQPKFSMTCFDAGPDAIFPPSCNEAVRLQMVSSRQEIWGPDEYLGCGRHEALYFYSSRAPTSTLGQTSELIGPSEEMMASSTLSPSAASSSRESESCCTGQILRCARDWRRSGYDEILAKGLIELADDNSTAPCPSFTQDAGQVGPVRELVNVYTKVHKCFLKAYGNAFQESVQRDNVEVAGLASVDLLARTYTISELEKLLASRHLKHSSNARVMSARNISNGRNYLQMSSMYEEMPQRNCKIVIFCNDRHDSFRGYEFTLAYEADATATFLEQEPDLQSKLFEQSSCNGADWLTQNQKLYPTWRDASKTKLQSIVIKRSTRRHCFVHFLRPGKGSDFRLGVEKRMVPQTEPCEPELRAWVQQAWDMRSEKGFLQFKRMEGFKPRMIRYMEFMETFKSKDFKVKMCKVTECSNCDDTRNTSSWECVLQSLKVKEMGKKGFKLDDVAMMVPLVHQLVEETTKLTLAMGDVDFVQKTDA